MSGSPGPVLASDTVGTLVRLTLLVRLIALGFAVLGLVYAEDRFATAAVMGLLVVTSHLGLQRSSVRALVVRHPALALPDIVIVSVTPFLVGADHPLLLVSVGSALLVGVLFSLRTAVPLTALLVTPHAVVAGEGSGWRVVETFGFAVVLLTVAAAGVAIRQVAEERHRSEVESARARSAAAAARERLRLARELHDTVAKSVQGVALTASALGCWIDRDPGVAGRHAEVVASAARDALAAARGLLTSLRLDDPERPLPEVLDELADRWEAEHGQAVTRELGDTLPLQLDQRHELVSALGEALENVARHAPGAGVRLRLEAVGDAVRATVTDDGPGFSPHDETEAIRAGHYGLTGMRERLASVGGQAEIRSAPGCGTEVSLSVPIADETARPVRGTGAVGRPESAARRSSSSATGRPFPASAASILHRRAS